MSKVSSKIRVRTGKGYPSAFNTVLGQRNINLISRRLLPLHRVWGGAESFCILEPAYSLTHTINSIPVFPRSRFLVTFEDYLPRLWPNSPMAFRLRDYLRECLSSDRCIRLLAMSEYAIRQFRDQNADYSGLQRLETKLELLYPSVLLRRKVPKRLGKTLRLIYVGNDFMRKGVPAVARAHQILRRNGIELETHVVSSLRWVPDDYIGPPSRAIVEHEKRFLSQDGVHLYGSLPNHEVMSLMERCDVFVFPTFHDTFGYVSLEAMSCGTPVITADTCAQSEVVSDGVCGYLLPIQNENKIGRWACIDMARDDSYNDAYMQQLEKFARALAVRVERLWGDSQLYERLSFGAIERIRSLFDREKARNRLEQIYTEAIA